MASGYLKTSIVINAMSKVRREEFVTEEQKDYAYHDCPLPIGHGQTISAPHMVAIMTEALDVREEQKILEIGAGSGYQAAVLAEIVKKGEIITVERIPEVAEFARENLKKAGYKNVDVIVGDGTLGYTEEAPYDRIIVTAGAPKIPDALAEQLADNGRLLIPVGGSWCQELVSLDKKSGNLERKNLGGCMFVPLIGKDGWN